MSLYLQLMVPLLFMSNCLDPHNPVIHWWPLCCSFYQLIRIFSNNQWAPVFLSTSCLFKIIPCSSEPEIASLVVLPKHVCVSSSSVYKLSQCCVFLLLCSGTQALSVCMQSYPSSWVRCSFQARDSIMCISVLALTLNSWPIWLSIEHAPTHTHHGSSI